MLGSMLDSELNYCISYYYTDYNFQLASTGKSVISPISIKLSLVSQLIIPDLEERRGYFSSGIFWRDCCWG